MVMWEKPGREHSQGLREEKESSIMGFATVMKGDLGS